MHNAQAGLYCIATGNCEASSSLAGRADTFACGYLEALAHLEREPGRPVLYVMGDAQLAATFAPLVREPPGSYGVALLLALDGDGAELAFDHVRRRATRPTGRGPGRSSSCAGSSPASRPSLGTGPRRYEWAKAG